jgi:hypothetical protein
MGDATASPIISLARSFIQQDVIGLDIIVECRVGPALFGILMQCRQGIQKLIRYSAETIDVRAHAVNDIIAEAPLGDTPSRMTVSRSACDLLPHA